MANTISESKTFKLNDYVLQRVTVSVDTADAAALVSTALAHPSSAPDEYWAVCTTGTDNEDITPVVAFDVANGEADFTFHSTVTGLAATVVFFFKWYEAADQDGTSITS